MQMAALLAMPLALRRMARQMAVLLALGWMARQIHQTEIQLASPFLLSSLG
jgi:hypothetical protein